MRQSKHISGIDPIFLVSFSLLVIGGLAILQSASSIASYKIAEHVYEFFGKQIIQGVIPGVVIFGLMSNTPFSWVKKFSLPFFIISIAINLLVLVPGIGVERMGATRWIDLGFITFQPSELMKIASILYIAALLEKLNQVKKQKGVVLGIFFISSIILIIISILQRDLSTGLLIMIIIASMLIQSPIKFHWIVFFSVLLFIAGSILAFAEPFRFQRIMTYVQGTDQVDILNEGYHLNQNMIAVGSGGLTGVGWNQSRQKFFYVPEPIGDSVFAVFAEEAGFIGVVILISVFMAISFRLIRIAYSLKEPYGQYILIGIVTWFVIQAFLNVGSTLGIIPITGMTLPFISYGSSSILALFFAFGIAANITKYRDSK